MDGVEVAAPILFDEIERETTGAKAWNQNLRAKLVELQQEF